MSGHLLRLDPAVRGLDIARAVATPGLLSLRQEDDNDWSVWCRSKPQSRILGTVHMDVGENRIANVRLLRRSGGSILLTCDLIPPQIPSGTYMDGRGVVWWHDRTGWWRLSPDGDPNKVQAGTPSGTPKRVAVCYLPCDLDDLKQ